MATNTVKAPGGGIVVDDQSGDTVIIPGVGIFAKRAAAGAMLLRMIQQRLYASG